MLEEFQLQKISTETLGEYLKSIRKHYGLTLEDVAQKTGIYEKFIYYIESGDYKKLPPDVYVMGFLKKLASLYEISDGMLIRQFKKERGIVNFAHEAKPSSDKNWKAWLKSLAFTPKTLTLAGASLIGLIAIGYIVFQVFSINRTPSLVVFEPPKQGIVKGASIKVAGKSDPGAQVSLNGQNIFVAEDGNFSTTIGAASGQNELRIESQNKFGKKNIEIVPVKVEVDTVVPTPAPTFAESLELTISALQKTQFIVQIDGEEENNILLSKGQKQLFKAQNQILLKSKNSGAISASLNGQDVGVLGKIGEEITIPFNTETLSLVKNNENRSVINESFDSKKPSNQN